MIDTKELTSSCIHCGLCTKHCTFLNQYQLDLQGFGQRPDLAYHCFLCDDCSTVCPKDISGRKVALSLRQQLVQNAGGQVKESGYRALLWEKLDYRFRNYKKGSSKSVLFPGCNFPSFYPKTTDLLIRLLKEKADIGVIFDCCGKPVSELGLAENEQQYTAALQKRLHDAGVEELVVLCPNCYYFLKTRLDIPLVSIYEKLQQLGLGQPILAEKAHLFVPCPDKKKLELEQSFLPFLAGEWENIPGIQCCGLGGCAAVKEPELSEGFRSEVKARQLPNVYTYCASCAGSLRRSGVEQVHHILVDLLGSDEQSELSLLSLWNRAKRKFY